MTLGKVLFENLRLIVVLFFLRLRTEMSDVASFIMLIIGNILLGLAEFVSIWALMTRFKHIGGWNIEEVALLFGIVQLSFAMAECFGRGFEQAYTLVLKGDFDVLLLRPMSIIVQLMGSDIALRGVAGILQGGAILIWALLNVSSSLHPLHALAYVFLSIACTALIFFSMFMLHGVLSFFVLQPFEPFNILTYGMKEAGSFPLPIYPPLLRFLVMYAFPVGSTVYLPIAFLLSKDSMGWNGISIVVALPLITLIVLLISFNLWSFAVKRYESTGS